MRTGFLLLLAAAGMAHAESLSADRLQRLDEEGYFTPAFKAAVFDLVKTREAEAHARKDTKKFNAALPDLQRDGDDAEAEVARLRQQLALYTHPEMADFTALQAAMHSVSVLVEQRVALAQAYIWSYPGDPHLATVEEELQQIENQRADRRQVVKSVATDQAAVNAELLKRAKAHALSLDEWHDFLRDKSQEELLALIGRPQWQGDDYWIYPGPWTWDPLTKKSCGLRVQFNGTRVLNVVAYIP